MTVRVEKITLRRFGAVAVTVVVTLDPAMRQGLVAASRERCIPSDRLIGEMACDGLARELCEAQEKEARSHG